MTTRAEPAAGRRSPRGWWLQALLVLQSPRAVFAALRDDSEEAAHARQEPITALVFLAGITAVLSARTVGGLLDIPGVDSLLVAALAVLAGGMYGFFGYWIGGGVVHLGARALGSGESYRRARHVLAFSAAPLALYLLVVWPVRLALYGGDLFRSGGADAERPGSYVFPALQLVCGLWMLALLVTGVRSAYRWGWLRSAGACSLFAALLVAVVVADVID